MDTASIISEVEAALATQMQLVGGDPTVEAAGEALLASLAPAFRAAALSLAEQAAEEVRAQMPNRTVDLVVSDGEPSLNIRTPEAQVSLVSGEQAARLTVRLPSNLKAELEDAAGDAGDSINTYVIKALASKAGSKKARHRITETFET
jgi:hypothetical protein